MSFLDKGQTNQIGFDFIMDELNVMTCYGEAEKRKLKPFVREEKSDLIHQLDNLETIIENFKCHKEEYDSIECLFCEIKDIKSSLKRCKELKVLDDIELFEIKGFCNLSNRLMTIVQGLNLNITEIYFNDLSHAFAILDPENKNMPTFHIYDIYSSKLKAIREKKRILEEKIIRELDDDEIQKLKEQRLNYVVMEEQEEFEIRKKLTHKLSFYVDDMNKNISSIGILDLILAKGKLSIKYNGVKPVISDDMNIYLKNATNPQVKELLRVKNKEFTPISIDLKQGVSIITGANMGGKSVTLKTIVLNVFLANMGFFVFCEQAIIPTVDFIGFVSDDMQSISKGLSTFGAEIIKLNSIVELSKKGRGFIVLDEFARGTNPKEGSYLVRALCRYLNKFNSITLISTHYDGIVEKDMVHYQVIGLKNVNFDVLKRKIDLNKGASVEIIQEHMDYRLERVSRKSKVPKDALNIAILLGMEKNIVNIVESLYKKGD